MPKGSSGVGCPQIPPAHSTFCNQYSVSSLLLLCALLLPLAVAFAVPGTCVPVAATPQPGAPDRTLPPCREQTRIEKSLPAVPNETVSVHNQFGNIDVRTAPQPNVTISVDLTAGADNRADAVTCLHRMALRARTKGQRLCIGIARPDTGICRVTQYQSNFVITLPPQTVLVVENSFGDVTIDGLQRSARATNRFGNTSVHHSNAVWITNAFGDVTAGNVTGGLTIENRNGNVTLHDVADRVDVTNEGGTTRLLRSRGDLRLTSKLGAVQVTDCHGRIQINSSLGQVEFALAPGAADTVSIASDNGQVCLDLSPQASAQIKAHAAQGRIETQARLAGQSLTTSDAGQDLTATLGAGQGRVDLQAAGAGIVIRSVK